MSTPPVKPDSDLSALFDLGLNPVPAPAASDWSPADLAAMFRHQLAQPILPELARTGVLSAAQLARYAAPPFPQTFADLLHRPAPPTPPAPLELLIATRQYAKLSPLHPESPLPPQIAHVLRLAADALALLAHQRRLSTLSDPDLRAGFQWALAEPWLDPATRTLMTQALALPLPLPPFQR